MTSKERALGISLLSGENSRGDRVCVRCAASPDLSLCGIDLRAVWRVIVALGARRGGRGMFRAGVRFHIARDQHRVYEHDPPPERLRSLNWTRFKRASFPFITCDEGLIGVRARRAIIRRNYVQLWQSDIRCSPTTQRGCSTTSRRSLTRQTPTTPQHHRTTQAHARNSIARARGRSWDCGG